jgi:hypothetical protein
MSEPITTDWNVFGNTLYLGEIGAPWVAFPGAMDDAQTIAQAHNDALAALRRRAEQAEADLRRVEGKCKIFEEMVLNAVGQLGDVTTPLPVGIAGLKGEALAARRLRASLLAWIEGEGFCPICGARIDQPHADGCALASYEQARKDAGLVGAKEVTDATDA